MTLVPVRMAVGGGQYSWSPLEELVSSLMGHGGRMKELSCVASTACALLFSAYSSATPSSSDKVIFCGIVCESSTKLVFGREFVCCCEITPKVAQQLKPDQ
eukprot:6484335-Amphidinium_carterae.1